MEIQHYIDEAGRIAKEHGWDTQEVAFPETIALVHSELSEALEEWRNGHPQDHVYFPEMTLPRETSEQGKPYKPEGAPIEMADAIIRIFHWASKQGINLEAAIDDKLKYNESRPYRHGGKKA